MTTDQPIEQPGSLSATAPEVVAVEVAGPPAEPMEEPPHRRERALIKAAMIIGSQGELRDPSPLHDLNDPNQDLDFQLFF